MVEIDEADLVMFFEEMPEEQSQEDIEFWNAPGCTRTITCPSES